VHSRQARSTAAGSWAPPAPTTEHATFRLDSGQQNTNILHCGIHH